MNHTEEREELRNRFHDDTFILEAVQRAIRMALLDHKRAGNPVAVWRDGKVVLVPPEEIPDFEIEPSEETKAT